MKELNLTPELLEKAEACKTAEELITLAKENNISTDSDEIKAMLNTLSAQIDDAILSSVSGGLGPCSPSKPEYRKLI